MLGTDDWWMRSRLFNIGSLLFTFNCIEFVLTNSRFGNLSWDYVKEPV